MTDNLQIMDMNQLHLLLQQLQQQLTSVTERVNQHDGILSRLDMLEKENTELKKLLQQKDLEISSLRSRDIKGAQSEGGEVGSSKRLTKTAAANNGSTSATPATFSQIATAAAKLPDPTRQAKKRLAAGRTFRTTAAKGPQGYEYVYIGRSPKIQRSEIRSTFRSVGVDLGRILDICFPASEVIGVLMHVQYVTDFKPG
ncbi:hypothetical protein BD408DRAFT_407114 [Parasitella parasitica]|nr:hypothetical protein BD408DRAFT_407114 [Parasitella parasitica]